MQLNVDRPSWQSLMVRILKPFFSEKKSILSDIEDPFKEYFWTATITRTARCSLIPATPPECPSHLQLFLEVLNQIHAHFVQKRKGLTLTGTRHGSK